MLSTTPVVAPPRAKFYWIDYECKSIADTCATARIGEFRQTSQFADKFRILRADPGLSFAPTLSKVLFDGALPISRTTHPLITRRHEVRPKTASGYYEDFRATTEKPTLDERENARGVTTTGAHCAAADITHE